MSTNTEPQTPQLPDIDPANAWATGCPQCSAGLVQPPPVTDMSVPLYVARAFQYEFGVLLTCNCRAGQQYEKLLRRVWQQIAEKDEMIPLTWSTALHTQINALSDAPTPVTMPEPVEHYANAL